MKTITYIMALISVALLLCLSVSASLASTSQISPGLEVISASAGMTVSAVRGNSVVFEKTDFSDAYRLNGDFSVTVLSLPDDASGLLKLGNTAVWGRRSAPLRSARFRSPLRIPAGMHRLLLRLTIRIPHRAV